MRRWKSRTSRSRRVAGTCRAANRADHLTADAGVEAAWRGGRQRAAHSSRATRMRRSRGPGRRDRRASGRVRWSQLRAARHALNPPSGPRGCGGAPNDLCCRGTRREVGMKRSHSPIQARGRAYAGHTGRRAQSWALPAVFSACAFLLALPGWVWPRGARAVERPAGQPRHDAPDELAPVTDRRGQPPGLDRVRAGLPLHRDGDPGPITLTAHASLFTGQSHRRGVRENTSTCSRGAATLAGAFRDGRLTRPRPSWPAS